MHAFKSISFTHDQMTDCHCLAVEEWGWTAIQNV